MGLFDSAGPYDAQIKAAFGAGTALGYVGAQADVASLISQAGGAPAAFSVAILEENVIFTGEAYSMGLALAQSADLTQPWQVIADPVNTFAGQTTYWGENGQGLQTPSGGYDTVMVVFDQDQARGSVTGLSAADATAGQSAQTAKNATNPVAGVVDSIQAGLKAAEDAIATQMKAMFKAEAEGAFVLIVILLFAVYIDYRHPALGDAAGRAATRASEV